MNRLDLPANIRLMNTSDPRIRDFKLVKSLDTFDGMDNSRFHPEGLFSTEIFGRVGTPERDTNVSFIHTKVSVLHPFIYTKLARLKGLYAGILTGKQYAKWNEEISDFESSDMLNGETGYSFFMSHLKNIHFKSTGSDSREINIKLVNKAIADGTAFVSYVPVYPAGLRDAFIEADGRVTEDEVNALYRTLLSATNSLPDSLVGLEGGLEDKAYDTTRTSIQNALNKIFEYFWQLFEGKRGFARDKYYSRVVFNGTRNVLTAASYTANRLGDKHVPNANSITMGLYQIMKGLLPVTTNFILNGWVKEVFGSGDGRARVADRKTRKVITVDVKRDIYDRFNTPEGINKLINGFADKARRSNPVMISGHYMGLVYKSPTPVNGKLFFKVFNDINDLPEHLSTEDVYPLTWIEFFYLSGYRHWNNYPSTFTRYPVAGLGSTYVGYVYCKTTLVAEQRWELDDNWGPKEFHDGNDIDYAYEYPIVNGDSVDYMETMSIASGRLAPAGGD